MSNKLTWLLCALVGLNSLGIGYLVWKDLKGDVIAPTDDHSRYGASSKKFGSDISNIKDVQNIELPGVDGKLTKLSDYKSKVIVLDFWATWCEPCVAMTPFLNKVQKEYENKDVIVLGVNIADDKETLRNFARKHAINYPIVLAEEGENDKLVKAFMGERLSLPLMFVIDKKGIIVGKHVGWPESKSDTFYAEREVLDLLDQALRLASDAS